MTFNELNEKVERGEIKYMGTAWARGYVSRKVDENGDIGYIERYNGRYGKGYKRHIPAWNSTRYHMVVYYIEQ